VLEVNTMNRRSLNPILAPLAGAAICFLALPWPGLAERTSLVEQLDGRAVSVAGAEDAGPIGIYIEHWSTDQEAAALQTAVAKGDAPTLLSPLVRTANRVGVVLLPGVQGRGARSRLRTPKNIIFARATDTPAGRRVIIASDERLGLGEPALEARKENRAFTVMDIRFGPDGNGVGKVADLDDMAYDPSTTSFEVKGYAARPARLVEVKSIRY
jgi:hypothetical protein